jgi:hypothetical protein
VRMCMSAMVAPHLDASRRFTVVNSVGRAARYFGSLAVAEPSGWMDDCG